ncbi:Cysteine-rich repeat secretory protein [Quillaja saponaria]|uniref:Cysteine-rich repeat secretory protein n=1 Tax=Quillaja saponaria TaxID=32244 RepID=A0AAD7QH30_QUISA|nr:Cysteine-rich repeat secretory protein [Quillaja saponaria]
MLNPSAISQAISMHAIGLLNLLSTIAPSNPRFFASGQISINPSTTLYGFVQCTRDLSPANCTNSLRTTILSFQSCCSRRRGARLGTGSSVVRFEYFPIFTNAAPAGTIFNMVSNSSNNTANYVVD